MKDEWAMKRLGMVICAVILVGAGVAAQNYPPNQPGGPPPGSLGPPSGYSVPGQYDRQNQNDPYRSNIPSQGNQRNPALEGPWNRDVYLWTSTDGLTFTDSRIVVARAGVPNVIRSSRGDLVAVFQWFPFENREAFDRVAVSFSKDDGATWSEPRRIRVKDLPSDYMRPFDPTIVEFDTGWFRLYFTSQNSSYRQPMIYSAISEDALNFTFEPGARSDTRTSAVDCTLVQWMGTWHMYAHPGMARPGKAEGYHAVSQDGLNFHRLPNVIGPEFANWIGNVYPMDGGLRYYGTSRDGVWSAFSEDGSNWTVEKGKRLKGGDSSIVRLSDGTYILLTVGDQRADASAPPFQTNPGGPPLSTGKRL